MKYTLFLSLLFLFSCSSVKKMQTKTYEKVQTTTKDTSTLTAKSVQDTTTLKKTVETDESTIIYEFNKPEAGFIKSPLSYHTVDSIYKGRGYLIGELDTTGKIDPDVFVPTKEDLKYILGNDYEGAEPVKFPNQSLKSITIIKKHTALKVDSSTGHKVDTIAASSGHTAAVNTEKKETVKQKQKTSFHWWIWVLIAGVGLAYYKRGWIVEKLKPFFV